MKIKIEVLLCSFGRPFCRRHPYNIKENKTRKEENWKKRAQWDMPLHTNCACANYHQKWEQWRRWPSLNFRALSFLLRILNGIPSALRGKKTSHLMIAKKSIWINCRDIWVVMKKLVWATLNYKSLLAQHLLPIHPIRKKTILTILAISAGLNLHPSRSSPSDKHVTMCSLPVTWQNTWRTSCLLGQNPSILMMESVISGASKTGLPL